MAEQNGVILKGWHDPESLKWISDSDIVSLILENLALNAVDQCRAGDSVESRIEYTDDVSLCLTVHDVGSSIPVSVRNKMFDLGITTKSNSTGFGLYYSQLRA
ncbi:ATP-binding protein [Candidatus Entotheonella palauensis]|uniref:ATP-binding protein n=1 Tax=Candidatus Entotheonella palauensis TaxID=93172 RepID=UPI001178681A